MKIYTGYYAKLKEYKEAGLFPIAISAKVPEGIKVLQWKFLAPTWELLKAWQDNQITNEGFAEELKYTVLMEADLDYINFVLEGLEKNGCDKVILLCYETPDKFCHRHIVAEFLTEKLGTDVVEYKTS